MKRNLLLLSTSTLYQQAPLAYAAQEITTMLKSFNVTQVLFVGYAQKDYDAYTARVKMAYDQMGFDIVGIHSFENPVEAVSKAEAIYVGGGNTFRLLNTLYEKQLIQPIQERIYKGIPYIGASAGTNVATTSICTTNDMPIVYPPSFKALGFIPFNINPHYMDPNPNSKHMGETRETRIREYHEEVNTPVLGLREGSMLLVQNELLELKGTHTARLFMPGKEPEELNPGDISFLMNSPNM